MKRPIGVLLAALLVACGGPAPQTQTPQQVVQASAQKMSQLKSAKYGLTATVSEEFPPALAQSFGGSGASSLTFDLTGTGQARFPDRSSTMMKAQAGGITIEVDTVTASGKTYVKNPQTGQWVSATQATGNFSQVTNQIDPLSAPKLLDTAKQVRDLGDTTVDGTAVHHYEIVPDRTRLAQQFTGPNQNAQAEALLQQMAQTGTFHIEVWIDRDDQYVRRLLQDVDASIDAGQLLSALGQGSVGAQLPPNSTIHIKGHVVLAYHDFNSPVTIVIPSPAS